MYYTYILKCSDNSYYVGSTNSLSNRLINHNRGTGATYTARRRPCFIIWYRSFNNNKQAITEERKIKKLSRTNKEKLVFAAKTVWKHFKGNEYIILNIFDDFIYYAELEKWNEFLKSYKKAGKEIQIWLRDKNQWLDIKSDNNQKILRFNLVH